ncbi:hypothetical protein YA38_17135 [Klebsiella aerogenes]|nr:hypothetical protein YA38_17135 [Klebsiella aerogenes]
MTSGGPARRSGHNETGINTGTGVTVKISGGCLVLMADSNKMQVFREELYQIKQAVKGMMDILI